MTIENRTATNNGNQQIVWILPRTGEIGKQNCSAGQVISLGQKRGIRLDVNLTPIRIIML